MNEILETQATGIRHTEVRYLEVASEVRSLEVDNVEVPYLEVVSKVRYVVSEVLQSSDKGEKGNEEDFFCVAVAAYTLFIAMNNIIIVDRTAISADDRMIVNIVRMSSSHVSAANVLVREGCCGAVVLNGAAVFVVLIGGVFFLERTKLQLQLAINIAKVVGFFLVGIFFLKWKSLLVRTRRRT